MKIVFLTASTSRNAGGLFFTITSCSSALKALGVNVKVIGIYDSHSDEDRKYFGNVSVVYYDAIKFPFLQTFGYSINLIRVLEQEKPDVIYLQGLWMYHSWAALKYKKAYPNVKIIIEPHGMLDPWAVKNSAWKKKIAGYLFEYKNLKTAHCIHALCKSEYESIRAFGLRNPVAIIPNGVDLPKNPIFKRNNEVKTLLYIGRLHPKKGLRELVDALGIIKRKNPETLRYWEVKIVGWDQNGHLDELKSRVSDYRLGNCVCFPGSMYGTDKAKELCNANAFILPSFSEGLPMSVLEAWSYRLPVLMTDFCNLPEGFSTNSAIRLLPKPEDIADKLYNLFTMPEYEIAEMGNNGYELVKGKFTWQKVAEDILRLYEWILNGGSKPEFVYD